MAKSNYLYKIYHSKLELEAKNHKNCCKFHFILLLLCQIINIVMMKKVNLIFWLLVVFVSCSNDNPRLVKLEQIDSLMGSNPQIAYDSICRFEKENLPSQELCVVMKFRLLKAKVQNKLYLKMPSDSTFQKVVSYYDSKGTANEKMEAHYLLGCIYRDQKDAPRTIATFLVATEFADTLNKKCNFNVLSCIYGQMGEIYVDQNLLEESLIAYTKSSSYALRDHDVYNYIRGKELSVPIFYMMGDTTKAISLTKQCVELYEKNRMHSAAVRALPTLIGIFLENHQYDLVRKKLMEFRTMSGLFNKDGELIQDRQHCYDLFGRYYLGIEKLDSAEFYFRKLRNAGFMYEAYRGLLAVFKEKNNVDSIIKYAKLSEQGMDTILANMKTDAVKQAASLYNYSKMQREITHSEQKVKMAKIELIIGFIILLCAVVLLSVWYKEKQMKKEKELEKLNVAYVGVMQDCVQLKNDIDVIRKNKDIAIKNKICRINELEKQLKENQDKYASLDILKKFKVWQSCDIVVRFKNMAKPRLSRQEAKENDWSLLEAMFGQCLPMQFRNVMGDASLGKQEQRICILVCAGFSNTEISVILDTSNQRVTNAKASANFKMFGEHNAGNLMHNLQYCS